MCIVVEVGGSSVPISRASFLLLLENSVVHDRAAYRRALETSHLPLADLLELSRKAEVPYVLFFAPDEMVQHQLKRKVDTLLRGISKTTFSINSRSSLALRDVELIVKDLLRKQEVLKQADETLTTNRVVGVLRKSKASVVEDAATLEDLLNLRAEDFAPLKSKEAAFNLAVQRFEACQILVSQSQQGYMPQRLPRGVPFSGLCVRDKKIPFVFLTGGEGSRLEPVGRRLFTLVLLGVLVAYGRFAALTYEDHAEEPVRAREYAVAEELLMPAATFVDHDVSSLDSVKVLGARYKVTPSAVVMRARRLGILPASTASRYFAQLSAEFSQLPKTRSRPGKPINAVRKYAGREYSRRMIRLLDEGRIGSSDFCRVVSLNKIKPPQIGDFRAAL